MPFLRIRDKDGNFVPIEAIKGDDGKNAYEYAKDGGYQGTEAEFAALLNGLTGADDAAHYSDLNNPHGVTASQIGLGNVDNTSDENKPLSKAAREAFGNIGEQVDATNTNYTSLLAAFESHKKASNPHGLTAGAVGAIPKKYATSANLNVVLEDGGGEITIFAYDSGTLNTPKSEGLTSYAHGMVITNAYSAQYGVQLCMPSGDSHMYIRKKDGNGISKWEKVCNKSDRPTIPTIPKISTLSSYTGNGNAGQSTPCTLTFEATPKFVIIMKHNASYVGFFVNGVTQYLVASNNGFSQSGNVCSWSGNTLSWYTLSSGQEYQLNAGTQKYTYYAGY